jgi:hypothetical protein
MAASMSGVESAVYTGDAGRLLAASGWRTNDLLSGPEMRKLAEQTRQTLAALTPSEVEDLRRRYGIQ